MEEGARGEKSAYSIRLAFATNDTVCAGFNALYLTLPRGANLVIPFLFPFCKLSLGFDVPSATTSCFAN